jgi:23S rRNA pseudouridine2605 synthase
MTERLQKIIAGRGFSSRRAAEELIRAGRVTVNGRPAVLGDTADPDTDEILIDQKPLPERPAYITIMLHKPRGYVTTLSDEKGRRDVTSLVTDLKERVYPVGRLDMDSEGLLIMTNDGALANRLMHPSFEREKEYIVTVRGAGEFAIPALEKPIEIDGRRTQGAAVRFLQAGDGKTKLSIIITEGRNRQIRRMCEAAGVELLRLKRVRMGALSLGRLPPGKWRHLTPQEIAMLEEG